MGLSESQDNSSHGARTPLAAEFAATRRAAATTNEPRLPAINFSCSDGIIRVDLGKDTAYTPAERARLKICAQQIRVNFYVHPFPVLATGYDAFSYALHGYISLAVEGKFPDILRQLHPDFPETQIQDATATLELNKVDGFRDGNDLSVRIEDRTKDLDFNDRAAMAALVEKYRRAVAIADHEVQKTGGTVTIKPIGEFGLMIAKILGELSRVSNSNQSGEQFIKRANQPLSQGRFFCSEAGTRFKSIEQFRNDLFAPRAQTGENASNLPPRFEDRATCRVFLKELAKFVDPAFRNNAGRGRREAQFLLIDPASRLINDSVSTAKKISDGLNTLATTLENEFPNSRTWAANLETVRTRLETFVHSLEARTYPLFHNDDLKNPEYVRIVAQCLRGDAGELEYNDDVHTPHKPLIVGRFISDEHGRRLWLFDSQVTPEVRALVEHVFRVRPEATLADWLCVLKPTEPLTHDHHPPGYVKDFGDEEDNSYLACFGAAGGDEYREVFREDAFAPSTWLRRNTTRVKQLLKKFVPDELTNFVHTFKDWQSILYNRVLQLADPESYMPIPAFKRAFNFLTRPLLGGKRIDLLNRGTMPFEQIAAILKKLGPIAVTNFITQRPVLSLRELLMGSLGPNYVPYFMRSIGVSESFSDALGAHGKTSLYERKAIHLYGTHVASWIAAYVNGNYATDLTESKKRAAVDELLDCWTTSFTSAYHNVVKGGFSTKDARDAYTSMKATLTRQGKTLPPEFDLTQHLSISEHLATKKPHQISRLADLIRLEAESMLRKYELLMQPPKKTNPSCEIKQSLINTIYALVSNHYATGQAHKVEQLIDMRRIRFSQFDLQARDWLLSLAGACLRLLETSERAERSEHDSFLQQVKILKHAALNPHSNEEKFLNDVAQLRSALNLDNSSTKQFYRALQGLHALWSSSEDGATQEQIRIAVAEASGNMIKFEAAVPVLEDTEFREQRAHFPDLSTLNMPEQPQRPAPHS